MLLLVIPSLPDELCLPSMTVASCLGHYLLRFLYRDSCCSGLSLNDDIVVLVVPVLADEP